MTNEFEWTFEVSRHLDPDKEEPTKITVYAYTYNQAVRKVVSLKLPSLDRVADTKEYLDMIHAIEIRPEITEDGGEEDSSIPANDN